MKPPIEYDSTSDTYHVEYDPTADDALGIVVASAVAAIEDVDVGDLPPVDEAVDPEAADDLLASAVAGPVRSSMEVEFSYCGYRVTAAPEDVVLRSIDA